MEFIKNFIYTCNENNKIVTRILKENLANCTSLIENKNGYINKEKQTSRIKLKIESKNASSNLEFTGQTDIHCTQCQTNFAAQPEFESHMNGQYCMYSSGSKCTICNFTATCKEALKQHDNENHKFGTKWKCNQCDKMYAKKYNLQLHIKQTHDGKKPFQCTNCNMDFVTQSTLNRHNKIAHSPNFTEIFECYICEKRFNRKDNLDAHMKNNHIKKQNNCLGNFDKSDIFSCNYCNKTFSILSYLENHLETHKIKSNPKSRVKIGSTNIKKYRFVTTSTLCSICGKYLTNKKSYYAHMQRKHSNIEYKQKIYPTKTNSDCFQCVICGKIITKLQNLKIHMRIHSGNKPYECKFCSKTFTHYTTWSAHENIHTGNKPFQCVQCNKWFTHRSCLRKHLRSSVHKGQKQ